MKAQRAKLTETHQLLGYIRNDINAFVNSGVLGVMAAIWRLYYYPRKDKGYA